LVRIGSIQRSFRLKAEATIQIRCGFRLQAEAHFSTLK
jgi:hypothetical protein